MIKVKELRKTFGKKKVFTNITATFLPGNVYGIVGANAAGKTTFFRCIAGLESYEGLVETASSVPLKDQLGYLVSEQYFLPKITGEEHVTLLTEARNKKVADIQRYNIFDLPLQEYVSTYSTGMKKKLAIMSVLLQGNNYFIFDEPYNGLDLQSSMLLTAVILKLKELDKIVLISSHIFSTLTDTCDEILLLEGGVIAQHVLRDDFPKLEEELKVDAVPLDLDVLLRR